MKTPLEAIDEAIKKWQQIREIVAANDQDAPWFSDFSFSVNEPLFFAYRPPENAGSKSSAVLLARCIGGNWTKDALNTWSTDLCGVKIFIHNAEPARNPQPEAVEL